MTASATDTFCPYVGLQPFTKEDRDYFFGRDRDIRLIASSLYASPLTVLYGASGVGKSSVLLAGVVPYLEASSRTAVVVFRDWQLPAAKERFQAKCCEAVGAAHRKPLELDPRLPLDKLLEQAAAAFRGSILIILDQFEEYFLYNAESSAETSFDAELARAINRDDVDANFLISLREDGLSRLDRFRARIPNLLGNSVRLRHLDAAAAEEAIRKPLAVFNGRLAAGQMPVEIEDELVQAVLSQVQRWQLALGGAHGVGKSATQKPVTQIETPFLQLVLTHLWEHERKFGSRVLQAKTFEALGGAQKIVRTYLDSTMDRLTPAQGEVCARFFDRLVTPTGGKIAYKVADLTEYAGDLGPEVSDALKRLSDARILRCIPAPDEPNVFRYEIFHDVLGSAILNWRQRFMAEKERREVERRTAEAFAARQRELEEAKALSDERARAAEEMVRSARKARRLLIFACSAIVIAIAALAYATTVNASRQRERERANVAQERASMAQASEDAAKQKEMEATAAAAKAEEATTMAVADRRKAEKANQEVIDKLQAQLTEAQRLIADFSNNAASARQEAEAYRKNLDVVRRDLAVAEQNAKDLEDRASLALVAADNLTKAAERSKGAAEASRSRSEQDKRIVPPTNVRIDRRD